MANEDIRSAAMAAGVYLWELAEGLGIKDASLSRKLRIELSDKDKERCFKVINERRRTLPKKTDIHSEKHSGFEIPVLHKDFWEDTDGEKVEFEISDWVLARIKNNMDEENCYRVVHYFRDTRISRWEDTEGQFVDVVCWADIPESLKDNA